MSYWDKSLEEKWATWVIGLSIATFLICGAAVGLWTLKSDMPVVQHKIVFCNDSLGNEVYSKSDVDSLINIVQNQERMLSQKYQYVLEERSKEDTSKALITFIVGAIISVSGFFGYKSFKDIKDHGGKIAETRAEETATKMINEQLPGMMSKEMTKIYKGQSLDVIKGKLTQDLTTTLESYIDAALADKVEEIKDEIRDNANNPAEEDNAVGGEPEVQGGGGVTTPENLFG